MNIGHRTLLKRCAAIACAALVFAHSAAFAEGDKTVEFDIDAQELGDALTEFGIQSGQEVYFVSAEVADIQTEGLEGVFTTTDAISRLLDDSGVDYVVDDNGTLLVGTAYAVNAGGGGDSGLGNSQPASTQVLMAQNQTLAPQTQPNRTNPTTQSNDDDNPRRFEEIIVTGTQIRGAGAAGANVVTIDRQYIEMSGLATTAELIQTVPQNFGDGANEVNSTVGLGAGNQDFGFSSSVNLRGLGTDSTLMLLNGRRSAAGGANGGFVDLNSIPASAIERIEVLPDGASAIYGSDAVGGVVNVILRDDYEGAETRIRYAPDLNDVDETQFSQVLGKSWDSGSILFAYEFYDRGSLRSEDRDYTSSSDLTRLGGTNHDVAASNPGNINRYTLADGSRQTVLFPIPSGQDGTALTPADLVTGNANLQNTLVGLTVLPQQTRHSGFVAVSQEISRTVEMFLEARYSTREFEQYLFLDDFNRLTVPSTNPFFVDPFGGSQNLRLDYSFVNDYGNVRRFGDVDTIGATLGATFDVSQSWQLDVYGSYNAEDTTSASDNFPNTALLADALADSNPVTAFNPFGDGSSNNAATLAAIAGFRTTDFESELSVVNLLADGELFQMLGGFAKLAIGAQFRDESLKFDETEFTSTPTPVPDTGNFDLKRDVTAAFAEIYLPVVSSRNSRPGFEQLALSIAARYEDYSDFGDTFDPKLGVMWSPFESLKLRGTFGTSFRAPLLTELRDTRFVRFFVAPDSASPAGTTNTIFLLGSDGNLTPQEGATWTVGFDFTPVSMQGLRVGLTYFETEVDDLIDFPSANIILPFSEPEAFASVLTRCPCDIALVTALFNDPTFRGSPNPVPPDEVGAIINQRRQNISRAELAGLDLDLSYAFDTDVGFFDVSLYASHLFDFERQLLAGPVIDVLNTITNPTSLKLRGDLSWRSGGLTAAIIGNHVGDYKDNISDPKRKVGSWTTWDFRLAYDFDNRSSGTVEGLKVSLSIRNVLDNDPPFVDGFNGVGFDSINANPLGRFAALQLAKEW